MAAVLGKFVDHAHNSSSGGFPGFIVRVALRFLQFVLGLTVIGLYATDLNEAHKVHAYADSKWVYAVVVGTLSSLTCIVYFIPFIKSWACFAWDWVLFILWIAVFGIFGKMYIPENPEGDGGITRMKHAVWIDLINMLLWFTTAIYGTIVFFFHRRKTLHTGRAEA